MKNAFLLTLFFSMTSVSVLVAQDIESKLSGHAVTNGFTVKNDTGQNLFTIRGNGKVGIGEQSPEFKLSLSDDGGILAKGTFGYGDTLSTQGWGSRLIWYPRKAAFRVGRAGLEQWNNINIGEHSIALGAFPLASGEYSTAIGDGAEATSNHATSIGAWTKAFGESATALGDRTKASGSHALAIGVGAEASGDYSCAYGLDAVASGNKSTSIGWLTKSSGSGSMAMGVNTKAMGVSATSLGEGCVASGQLSTAMGGFTIARGILTTAMGDNTIATAYGSTVIGRFNIGGGDSLSWQSSDPVFEIGIGTPIIHENAITVLKNGKVGILTATPSYTLHVVGDAGKAVGGTTWINASDIRLKDILGDYKAGLDEIVKLHSIHFQYKKNNARDLPSDTKEIGFIAQEIQKIFPECVTENADGYLDFNMHPINVALVNAVKELNEQLHKKSAELHSLRADLEEMKSQMKELKQLVASGKNENQSSHAELRKQQ